MTVRINFSCQCHKENFQKYIPFSFICKFKKTQNKTTQKIKTFFIMCAYCIRYDKDKNNKNHYSIIVCFQNQEMIKTFVKLRIVSLAIWLRMDESREWLRERICMLLMGRGKCLFDYKNM